MSIEKYTRFITLLHAGLPIPPDLAQWFLSADEQHKETGKSLCHCLGIRGPGIRSAKTRKLIQRRDTLLEWAVNGCTSYPGEHLWNRCGTLAKQLKRYPRSKNENPLLQHIFALGCSVPLSQNGVYERIIAIGKSPPYSPSKKRR